MEEQEREYDPNYGCKVFEKNGYYFYQRMHNKKIYWVHYEDDRLGYLDISFDKIHILNLWSDYPSKFTKEQIEIFKEEEPYWAEFFDGRK